ncbi:5625_t:CDS:1, partial [Funneliformis mosseae]
MLFTAKLIFSAAIYCDLAFGDNVVMSINLINYLRVFGVLEVKV